MSDDLQPRQAFILYGVILSFLFTFYVAGLLVGRDDTDMAASSAPTEITQRQPVEDIKPRLDLYEDLTQPNQKAADPEVKSPPPQSRAESEEVVSARLDTRSSEVSKWILQLGAYRSRKEAEHLVSKLKAQNFSEAYVKPPLEGQSDSYFRVWLGAFADPDQAAPLVSDLKEQGFSVYLKQSKE